MKYAWYLTGLCTITCLKFLHELNYSRNIGRLIRYDATIWEARKVDSSCYWSGKFPRRRKNSTRRKTSKVIANRYQRLSKLLESWKRSSATLSGSPRSSSRNSLAFARRLNHVNFTNCPKTVERFKFELIDSLINLDNLPKNSSDKITKNRHNIYISPIIRILI